MNKLNKPTLISIIQMLLSIILLTLCIKNYKQRIEINDILTKIYNKVEIIEDSMKP